MVIMAAKTATRKPAKVVSREETAEVVVNETTVAEAAGRELAASFSAENISKDNRLFEQARIAFHAGTTGAKASDIAKATTKVMAELFDEADREWAENTSVVNGGAKVTRVTIVQRSDAFGSILSAGIEVPNVELVTTAYRAFTSKGANGLAEAHKALIAETLALPEPERAAHYLANARAVSAGVVAANKAKGAEAHSEKSATASADAKADTPVVEVTLDNVTEVIALIRAEVARPWSDDDKALLMASLAEIIGA